MNKRYVPNLKDLHSLAERNYSALARLLPRGDSERTIHVGDLLQFELRCTSESRYTTDLQVTQVAPDVADYLQARFLVRLYHDARMAEIIDCQGQDRLTALQGKKLHAVAHQKDEKLQLSQHLSEWLKLCFRQGRAASAWQFAPVG
ncbi:DUF1249 domain-containing protein [Aliidiomarina indica]|uniref:DUF1249 domain-containing protein n=1 Tax=Aliidiomarina indica TaxID=2749147 RepID=UPI00188E3A1F|nr:DUF1249 domain-containing protein [Aliidiomarina indica]